MGIHFLNNQWVKERFLKISVFDLSVSRGYGAFEFLRTYNKKAFFLDDHLERFFNTLKILEMEPVKTKNQIKKIIKEGIKINNFKETDIKIIQTGGKSKNGLLPYQKGNLIILFLPHKDLPKKFYEEGVKVITFPCTRIFPSAKSLNYLGGIVALKKAKELRAFEVLYTDKNLIYEGVTSNFFAVIKKTIITPKDNILKGITRKIVINLAKKLNYQVREGDLYLKDINKFEEAFLTATNKEILPVKQIDNFVINKGKIGFLTKNLIEKFYQLVKEMNF